MTTFVEALSTAAETAYAENKINHRQLRLLKRHLKDDDFLQKAQAHVLNERQECGLSGDIEDWADVMLFLVSLVGTLIRLFLIFV